MPSLYFSSDLSRIDVDTVLRWLSEESYWALGRTREKHVAAMAGSRNYGIYDGEGGPQLAYARAITDGATFAWIADVFVDPDARGRGVGVALMEGIMGDLEPFGLKRVGLVTKDAHGLYEKFGFTALPDADWWMTRLAAVSLPY